uniref:Uncharacterized protein n=1 Tax=Setaria italica TaxID=4555 RepID=K3XRE1_SETIT
MGNLVSQCIGRGVGTRCLVVVQDCNRMRLEEHSGVTKLMINAPGHVVACASDVMRELRPIGLLVSEKKKSRKSMPAGGKVFSVVNDKEDSSEQGKEALCAGKRAQNHYEIQPW